MREPLKYVQGRDALTQTAKAPECTENSLKLVDANET